VERSCADSGAPQGEGSPSPAPRNDCAGCGGGDRGGRAAARSVAWLESTAGRQSLENWNAAGIGGRETQRRTRKRSAVSTLRAGGHRGRRPWRRQCPGLGTAAAGMGKGRAQLPDKGALFVDEGLGLRLAMASARDPAGAVTVAVMELYTPFAKEVLTAGYVFAVGDGGEVAIQAIEPVDFTTEGRGIDNTGV